jgi:hypothetical protein
MMGVLGWAKCVGGITNERKGFLSKQIREDVILIRWQYLKHSKHVRIVYICLGITGGWLLDAPYRILA